MHIQVKKYLLNILESGLKYDHYNYFYNLIVRMGPVKFVLDLCAMLYILLKLKSIILFQFHGKISSNIFLISKLSIFAI